eukprot:TRINITY_DN11736_c0_g1_i1.p1 TRINITY_DN11736_c0_g1~~TRINITY_DN11736_c0_g1_i1.p1  ORF type:complete len:382 (-),score=85.57 TRINITY_DN11736_c0_g1_i1:8-994(-)
MKLLMQIYAPLPQPNTFHRVIYVFTCVRGTCISRHTSQSMRILRAQIPEDNDIYQYNDIGSEEDSASELGYIPEYTIIPEKRARVCNYCGLYGTYRCNGCKLAYYCTKEHQILDWKSQHKQHCSILKEAVSNGVIDNVENIQPMNDILEKLGVDITNMGGPYVYKEYEIETADEQILKEEMNNNRDIIAENEELLERYKSKVSTEDFDEQELLKEGHIIEDDAALVSFQETIRTKPNQVLRYAVNKQGSPLWVTDKDIPIKDDIPHCNRCGEERTFEFQIQPQLLYFLDIDEVADPIDFGILVIYTCKNSCDTDGGYVKEFVWRQIFK